MEKKTLQEIKDNLAIEAGYISWGGYVDSWRGAMPENVIDIIAKAYAKQVETKENQKQLLVDLMKTDQEYGMYEVSKESNNFYCKEQDNVGYTCEDGQCQSCAKVDGKESKLDFEAMADEYSKQAVTEKYIETIITLPQLRNYAKKDFQRGMERIWKDYVEPLRKEFQELREEFQEDNKLGWDKAGEYQQLYKSLQSELSALREERTNHIHEIVRLNEELSKYDSHHP